jgi:hypothetical protein
MSNIQDKVNQPSTAGFGLGYTLSENPYKIKGQVYGVITHANGTEEQVLNKNNIYTLDGGVLASMLFAGELGVGGVTMLAVGTGATGLASAPDVADNRQRKLNSEIARKPFSSIVYRNATTGEVSNIPTNILDLTTVFTETEASGAGLTEMGLLSTISQNVAESTPTTDVFPTRSSLDLRSYDRLINYLTFPVIHKPQGAVLALTWRLTF